MPQDTPKKNALKQAAQLIERLVNEMASTGFPKTKKERRKKEKKGKKEARLKEQTIPRINSTPEHEEIILLPIKTRAKTKTEKKEN